MQGGDRDTVWGSDVNPVMKAPEKNRGNVSNKLDANNPEAP
jgi:hypothetical protein